MINSLKKSMLFRDVSGDDIMDSVSSGNIFEKKYFKNEYLIKIGDKIKYFGLVSSGNIQVSTSDINGNRMIMANVSPGETFAESLAYIGTESSPVYAVASEDSSVIKINIDLIKEGVFLPEKVRSRLKDNFMTLLAVRTLSMNNRIQILSKKSIREKVIAFLTVSVNKEKNEILIPFSRGELADYLGVDRSALSRELSNMARNGEIGFEKNKFWILEHYSENNC